MDRIIKKKKPEHPDWLIYSLKGLLLFLLFWNINQQFPNGILAVTNHADTTPSTRTAPYIEEISFNQLLSTTKPKINHFMEWGTTKIPYLDPTINQEETISYITFSAQEFAKIWSDTFTLAYKGHVLTPHKINAIFIRPDSSSSTCETTTDWSTCFYENLRNYQDDFALWLSIETVEQKTYFTRIKITEHKNSSFIPSKETIDYWTKLINRDIHKSIDNLTVTKPVFRHHEYLFKWGDWERYAHGPRGGRRIKVGIQTFQSWIHHQPFLYKDSEFIPFSMSINHWDKKRRNHCFISRKEETATLITNNECFRELVEKIEVGHTISIFFHMKEDFIKNLSAQTLSGLPGFVFNDQYIRFSLPIEIVERDFNASNAPLNLRTTTFGFQLNSASSENAVVKLDKHHPKNKSLIKHYSESESAEIIHIEAFKTVRRVITQDDIFIHPSEIEQVYTLQDKVFKTETFPEFYDFTIQPPLIKFRGLSTVLDKTTYDLVDFHTSKERFEFYIGEEKVKLLQATFTVIPKSGKATQYITNSLNRGDIKRCLKKLKPATSLYFDKLLFERANGEQMLFPLTTALHLK